MWSSLFTFRICLSREWHGKDSVLLSLNIAGDGGEPAQEEVQRMKLRNLGKETSEHLGFQKYKKGGGYDSFFGRVYESSDSVELIGGDGDTGIVEDHVADIFPHWEVRNSGVILLRVWHLSDLPAIGLENVHALLPALVKGQHKGLLCSKNNLVGVVLDDLRQLNKQILRAKMS